MPLKTRILLWVSSLFLVSISCVFIISNVEISHNLKKEENQLIKKIKQVDDIDFKNILLYLSINFNNEAEKMYHVFEYMRSSPQWRPKFLPDPYNIRTKSWGSSAALLETFPWIDFISININDELGSYIHQSAPYLRKYVKVPINEDLTLFTTKRDDGCLCAYVGVPFWSNQAIKKYIDDEKFPDFFLAKAPDQWLLYEPEQLINIDTSNLIQRNKELSHHLFDQGITTHTQLEFDYLVDSVKKMVEVTKEKLLKHPDLLKTLNDPKIRHEYMKRKIKQMHPNLLLQRNYCVGPLCNFSKQRPEPKWATRRDFEHKIIQKDLIWNLCMLLRTGIWGFTPFADDAPKGIVTAMNPTTDNDPLFFKNVTEGFFTTDVFIDHPLKVKRECTVKAGNPEYDKKIIFKGSNKGSAKSCINPSLKILYQPELKEPFLTSTNFITYLKPPMTKPNTSEVTFGIALDPFFINLALVSPDDVAFIVGDQDIRLYTTEGAVVNIKNDDDWNRETLLSQKEGSLTDKDGNKIFFRYLGNITENDGHIVLIEREVSRAAIIQEISRQVKALSEKVTIESGVVIIIALIATIFILLKVLSAITKPIKALVEITTHVSDRSLEKIHIEEANMKRKDEIGTLYNAFNSMIISIKEGNKVRGLLDKVVSKQVAAKIVKEGIKLGGEKRYLTVMFCDIRNFTSTSENMDPKDNITMLNECLTLLSGVIDDFEGVIDKYEGDRIMTLFGAPLETKNHELQATLCAIEMQRVLSIWNATRESSGFCKLEVGIGIHAGEAIAGNVGAENHLSYTVLGPFVNLTSRVCDFAEAREILITREILAKTKDHVEYQENPAQQFKGISQPVVTYSILKKK